MILLAVLGIFILPFSASAAVLLDQPLDGATPPAYTSQWAPDQYTNSMFIADDFTNAVAWDINIIFIPGNFNGGGANNLNNANFLNWQIYTDTAGVPAGCPQTGEVAPIWSISLAPTDSQVAITNGSGSFPSNVTLTLSTPINLAPGTYWLLFYPEMDYEVDPYDGYYGRQPATTANGATAKARNPQGGFNWGDPNPTVTTWINWMDTIIGWGTPTARTDSAFRLEGTPAGPNITVSAPLAFGNVQVTTTTAPRAVTISNTGTLTLNLNGITITGTNANQFAKGTTTCGATLAAGLSCTQNVTFSPTSVGAKTASVEIATNDPDTPTATVGLSGTGVSPAIAVSPATLAFGSILVGATSVAQTITITNTGDADLNISAITINGADSGQFVKAGGTCGTTFPKTLIPAASCTQTVTFNPTTVGAKVGNVAISAPYVTTANVALSGTGVSPNIAVSPATLAFGSVLAGDTSVAQTVTISNTGTADLSIASIIITGTNSTEFALATGGTCGTTFPKVLAASTNCTQNVTFVPATVGAKAATLTIASNDLDTPTASVPLTGTGISPDIAVAPVAIDFDPEIVGDASPASEVTISNIGTAPLVVNSIVVSGANAAMFARATGGTTPCASLTPTIAAGANCTVNVTFTPTSVGAKTASLDIASNDGDTPTANVPLTGTGIQGELSVTEGTFGTAITLNGSGFGENGKVYVGGLKQKIDSWSPTAITVIFKKYKDLLIDTPYNVSIEPKPKGTPVVNLPGTFTLRNPAVNILTSDLTGLPEAEVTIKGLWFGSTKPKVFLGGQKCKVKSFIMDATTGISELVFVVHKKVPAGLRELQVQSKIGTSAAVSFLVL